MGHTVTRTYNAGEQDHKINLGKLGDVAKMKPECGRDERAAPPLIELVVVVQRTAVEQLSVDSVGEMSFSRQRRRHYR